MELLKDYKYENAGQFRAILESLGYKEEYNQGTLKFTNEKGESHKLSLSEIKEGVTKPEESLSIKEKSKSEISQFFDKEEAKSNFTSYKKHLEDNYNVTLFKWDNLKKDQVKSEKQSIDGFTIIDHNNKVSYTGKSLYDHAYENGFVLDGQGTQLAKDEYSKLQNIEGKKGKYYRGENNKMYSAYAKTQLEIPDELFGKKIKKEQKEALLRGELVPVKSKNGAHLYMQIDKELNAVIIKSNNEIKIPSQIGGHQLDEIELTLLINGKYTPPLIMNDNGNFFKAEIALTADKQGYIYRNIENLSNEESLRILSERERAQNKDITMGSVINTFDNSPDLVPENIKENNFAKTSDLELNKETPSTKDPLEPEEPQKQNEGDNLSISTKVSSDDRSILVAIANEDFVMINKMVEAGYKTTPEFIDEFNKLDLSDSKKVGLERLLDISKPKETIAKIKMTEDPNKEKGKSNIKQPILNATNSLFNNM